MVEPTTDLQMEEVNKGNQQEHTNGNSHDHEHGTTTNPLKPSSSEQISTNNNTPQQTDTATQPPSTLPLPTAPTAQQQQQQGSLPFSLSPSAFSIMNLIPADLVNFSATSTSGTPLVFNPAPTTTSPSIVPAVPSTASPASTTTPSPSPTTPAPAPAPSANSPPISFEEFLLSFGGQNLSDEEFAVKLQQYYEMTDAQAASGAAAAAAASAAAASADNTFMMDEDEKLAKKLQEQFYSEVTKEPKPYSSSNSYGYKYNNSWNQAETAPSPTPSPPHAPPVLLTPQTATTVLKNIGTSTSTSTSTSTTSTSTTTSTSISTDPATATTTSDVPESQPVEKPEEESEIVCLICHDSEFEEYIILPACEHRYCIDCASRMMTTPPTNSYAPSFGARRPKKANGDAGKITCAMCESVTDLDPVVGLDGLKRRVKKRKAGDAFSGDCALHTQPLLFYCFDHSEPVCFACIQLGGPHNGHKYDALDSAVAKLKTESANKLITVNEKRQKINEFKNNVEQHKSQIETHGEKKYVELKEYLAKVRKLLDKKEKDLETEVKRMIDRKTLAAQQEIKWADEKLGLLDKTIAGVGALLDEHAKKDSAPDACLRFVAGLAECEELLADSIHLPSKTINPEQYNFPTLTTAFSLTLRAINNLSYTDSLQAPGLSSYDDDYSDEEAAEGEEDIY